MISINTDAIIYNSKKQGFSDFQISKIMNRTEAEIREFRYKHKILPVVKQIDTVAGEFPCHTNYLYLTYNGIENDFDVDNNT